MPSGILTTRKHCCSTIHNS